MREHKKNLKSAQNVWYSNLRRSREKALIKKGRKEVVSEEIYQKCSELKIWIAKCLAQQIKADPYQYISSRNFKEDYTHFQETVTDKRQKIKTSFDFITTEVADRIQWIRIFKFWGKMIYNLRFYTQPNSQSRVRPE